MRRLEECQNSTRVLTEDRDRVAVRCSVLQRETGELRLQVCVAVCVCCGFMLQCVPQCVAACCRVLPCVAAQD